MRIQTAACTVLSVLSLGVQAAVGCGTLHAYPFAVIDRTGNLAMVVGHVDTRNEGAVSFAASLAIDATILADLKASAAAGCSQSITQTSYGSNWAWNSAAGGYSVDVKVSVQRPSLGRTQWLQTWTDQSSVGPFVEGEGSEQPVHTHSLALTKSMVRRVALDDQVLISSAGMVWAEAYTVGVFHQAYGSYGYGAVFEQPLLQIYLP